jgi:hypothetical protein
MSARAEILRPHPYRQEIPLRRNIGIPASPARAGRPDSDRRSARGSTSCSGRGLRTMSAVHGVWRGPRPRKPIVSIPRIGARSRGHVAALGRERVADLLLERRDLACTISPPDCNQGPACMGEQSRREFAWAAATGGRLRTRGGRGRLCGGRGRRRVRRQRCRARRELVRGRVGSVAAVVGVALERAAAPAGAPAPMRGWGGRRRSATIIAGSCAARPDHPADRRHRTPPGPSPQPPLEPTTQGDHPAATRAGSAATTTPAHDRTQGSPGPCPDRPDRSGRSRPFVQQPRPDARARVASAAYRLDELGTAAWSVSRENERRGR